MSVPVHIPQAAQKMESSRAAAAYRAAERLGRSSRRSSEWQRLCDADRTRSSVRPFSDLFSDDSYEIEDTDFYDVPEPDGIDHKVRSAYLLAAVLAGTFCMVVGAFFVL